MKRLLMATTALCLGAGTAAAEVALSGSAEMGVAGSKDDSARFHTDIDVTFTLSGTTDAGVMFGSAIDIDEASDDDDVHDDATQDDDDDGGIAVFMSDPDGFGTVTMGDTAGAIAWAVSDARGAGPGSIRDNHEHGGSSGNDGLDAKHDNQILRWDRAIGSGFSMAASVELDDDTGGTPDSDTHDPILGVGGTYSMPMGVGTLGLGGGFQMGSFNHTIAAGDPAAEDPLWDSEVEATAIGGSVSLDFGNGGDGIKVVGDAGLMEADGSVSDEDGVAEVADVESMHLGLGLGYTVGAISIGVNVGTNTTETTYDIRGDNNATMVEETVEGVGFSAQYDLGGGAKLQFGVGSSKTDTDYAYGSAVDLGTIPDNRTRANVHDSSSDTSSWSLGVAFSF